MLIRNGGAFEIDLDVEVLCIIYCGGTLCQDALGIIGGQCRQRQAILMLF